MLSFFPLELSQWLRIPWPLMAFLPVLIWTPFVIVLFIRQSKESVQERKELQARFDAEDKVLFGQNRKLS